MGEADRLPPGDRLNVFLLNQSESMGVELREYGLTIAAAATDSINLYLQKLYQVRETGPEAFVGDSFAVSVIGYGRSENAARSLLYIDPSGTKADDSGTRRDNTTISSDATHPVYPTWIVPAASGGAPLSDALNLALKTTASWVSAHKTALPPNIINITDGSITDGYPVAIVERLSDLSTDLGRAVFWNYQLTDSHQSVQLFPVEDLAPEPPLRTLLRLSSPLPKRSIPDVMLEFPEVSKIEGAKACVLNGDLPTLVRFISCVTRLPLP